MPKELIEKTIDGETYQIGQATTSKQLVLLTRLNRLILEPLGSLAGSAEKFTDLENMQLDIKAATAALAKNLDEKIVLATVKELLEVVIYNGQVVGFDVHFQGRLGHMFKVVYAVLEAQYADFFEGLSGFRGSVLQALKQKKVPSGGPSGDPSSQK